MQKQKSAQLARRQLESNKSQLKQERRGSLSSTLSDRSFSFSRGSVPKSQMKSSQKNGSLLRPSKSMSAPARRKRSNSNVSAGRASASRLCRQNFENIVVLVRCRPMNSIEKRQEEETTVECSKEMSEITCRVNEPGGRFFRFTFDEVFNQDAKQADLYPRCRPLISSVLDGYNATIFAYGQSGAGKTFTMEGPEIATSSDGILQFAFEDIFLMIKTLASPRKRYLISASYVEIYNEALYDLLASRRHVTLRYDSVYGNFNLNGEVRLPVTSAKGLRSLLNKGSKLRNTGSTGINLRSSRSHAVFTITVESQIPNGQGAWSTTRVGKLNCVDLAGSERVAKAKTEGKRLKEAGKINQSLFTLGMVINSLVTQKELPPYRSSKLTSLLKDSLGGNSYTLVIACIGPAGSNSHETISTLKFANKLKQIRNSPMVNDASIDGNKNNMRLIKLMKAAIDKMRPMLVRLREENRKLKAQSEKKIVSVDLRQTYVSMMPSTQPNFYYFPIGDRNGGEKTDNKHKPKTNLIKSPGQSSSSSLSSAALSANEKQALIRTILEPKAAAHDSTRKKQKISKYLSNVERIVRAIFPSGMNKPLAKRDAEFLYYIEGMETENKHLHRELRKAESHIGQLRCEGEKARSIITQLIGRMPTTEASKLEGQNTQNEGSGESSGGHDGGSAVSADLLVCNAKKWLARAEATAATSFSKEEPLPNTDATEDYRNEHEAEEKLLREIEELAQKERELSRRLKMK